MLEEYSQVFSEFLNVGLQEKIQSGQMVFANMWNWVNENQVSILCAVAGVIIGMAVSKMRKKQ